MTRVQISAAEFEQLYRATAGEVHGYLRRRVGDDAADLLSEVYVVAWRRRGDLPGEDLRRAWLYGVARRLLLSHHRGVARTAEAERSVAPPVDDDGERAEGRAAIVREALAALSESDRELIQLTEWEGLSASEAALTIGIKPGTARVRLHRARGRLAADPRLRALVGAELTGRRPEA
ncbi:RNA polymerase sigma factor [Nocardioides sp. MH1]|uniref:RNA polymerase sigma factor n=1 Tax=Nocardioides sp. MH1 TaxID=3242490 RepID=UPI0035206785